MKNSDKERVRVTLRQYEAFLKTVECAGVSAAAQALAERFGLAPSGGSDYHGLRKPDIALGSGRGGLRVPYAWLAGLKALAGPGRV